MIFPSPSSPLLSYPFFGWTLNCLHLHQLLGTLNTAQFFVLFIRKFSPCVVKNLPLTELTSSFLLFLLPVNRSRQSVRLCSYVKPSIYCMCAWNNALAYFQRNTLVPIYYQLGNLCFGKKNVPLLRQQSTSFFSFFHSLNQFRLYAWLVDLFIFFIIMLFINIPET